MGREAKERIIEEAWVASKTKNHKGVLQLARAKLRKELTDAGLSADQIKESLQEITLADINDWVEGLPARLEARNKEKEEETVKAREATKQSIIEDAFNAYENFGNVAKTLAAARQKDKTITRQDVQEYKDMMYVPLKKHRGINSFIPRYAHDEYQIDLMFFDDLKKPDDPYIGALLAVDTFSKYCWAEPITDKTPDSIVAALRKCFAKMGDAPPKILYHDAEGAFVSKKVQDFLYNGGKKNRTVESLTTLGHAPVAERTIRTIKGLLYPRAKAFKRKWWQELPRVLEVYNDKDVHRSTGFTPALASQEENHDDVKLNLEMNRRTDRKYAPISEGDKVRILRKKKLGEKENNPPWTEKVYHVTEVTTKQRGRNLAQPMIYVKEPLPPGKKFLLRHEALKVPQRPDLLPPADGE